jgi:hypothetical protein
MNKLHFCDVCTKEIEHIWAVNKSVPPNLYSQNLDGVGTSRQDMYFCKDCQTLANIHDFTVDDLFGDYVYRTPNTSMDTDIVNFLSSFIEEKNIVNAVEIAGNNGVFANKLIEKVNVEGFNITVIDKVELAINNCNIKHIHSFLEHSVRDLFSDVKCDVAIVRHALAHNISIKNFFGDIVSILDPDYLYVENASLISTFNNQDYSQLYSEHYFQMSPLSIATVAKSFGYSVLRLEEFEIHNGSFGILLHKGEKQAKLPLVEISSDALRISIEQWASSVRDFWLTLSQRNKKIMVWGCSAKFLFTYSALDLAEICPVSYIVDSTPEKWGLYAPGTSVMVCAEEDISELADNLVFVIGARNFEKHITQKILKIYPSADIHCPPF